MPVTLARVGLVSFNSEVFARYAACLSKWIGLRPPKNECLRLGLQKVLMSLNRAA
jgi:hypothetical protein